MTAFRLGERVALKSCTDFPGTVTGIGYGKVEVRFDDFSNEAPKAFRPDSLQLAEKQVTAPRYVPKSSGFGTWRKAHSRTEESVAYEGQCKKLFGTPDVRIANGS